MSIHQENLRGASYYSSTSPVPKRILQIGLKTAIYLLFLISLWLFLTDILQVSDYLIPPIQDVLSSFASLWQFYMRHFVFTLIESLGGASLGFTLGITLGLILRYSGPIGRALNPLVIASQVFPKEALAPLILVFLGFGMFPKIVISTLICFFPVAISTQRGLYAVPESYNRLMHILGASPWQIFKHCHLPFAAPYILASLRVCATLSVIGAVVGEFVGSTAGLGYVIRAANASIATDQVYAALILLGCLGGLLFGIAVFAEQILFGKYTRAIRDLA